MDKALGHADPKFESSNPSPCQLWGIYSAYNFVSNIELEKPLFFIANRWYHKPISHLAHPLNFNRNGVDHTVYLLQILRKAQPILAILG